MEREVRYCTTEDGVRIAYCVEGEGPPLVLCPEFIESFSLDHLFPELQTFIDRLGEGRRMVRFDWRGSGLSQREIDDFSLDAGVRDIVAVVRSSGVKGFALWASGAGGPRAIAYAGRHYQQMTHLILYGTYARLADVFTEDALRSFADLARTRWDIASHVFADLAIREQFPDAALGLAEIFRESGTGEVIAKFIMDASNIDVTPLLPTLRVRTLVLHRRDDSIFDFSLGQRLAAQIPGARLVPLEGFHGVHYMPLGDQEAVIRAAHTFLEEGAGRRRAKITATQKATAPGVRSVLFTDIAGSTEMMQRLGDERGREVLREHERITREVLKAHGGTEVKTMGDGFMASFGSVTKAVECAIALQRAFEERNEAIAARGEPVEPRAHPRPSTGSGRAEQEPIVIRVGLNAGEPIEEEGDLFGATVILASRIAAQAEGGEVLASLAVRELCAGKGFLFADRGEHALRGFEDPVRMFEVRWRE